MDEQNRFNFGGRCLARRALACALLMLSISSPAQQVWDGPMDGPPGQRNKRITFISYDFRNGGITSAYRGLFTAAKELGWQLRVIDGHGSLEIIRAAFSRAVDERRDGIVLGGFGIDMLPGAPQLAKQSSVVLVGWHAAANPGPSKALFTNVTTAPDDVARLAANFVIASSQGQLGVVIFNDDRFAIANAKTARMAQVIGECGRCKVLAIENIRIEEARTDVPPAVAKLNQLYGRAWTHNLAVNDAYFDAMNVALVEHLRTDIHNVSAGDGSTVAISRIGSGMSQQVATVAEPTGLQGWQLADELNRAFSGQLPSGYVSQPILVTAQLLASANGNNIEAHIPYQQAYRAIWHQRPVLPH
jgi:ribose transport system substrate-binding protein